jgi:hypothetical protein
MKNSSSLSSALTPQEVEAVAIAINRTIGSEPAKVFRTAFAAAPDDNSPPQDYAFAAVIAQLLAEPHPAGDRVDRIAVLIKLARPAT